MGALASTINTSSFSVSWSGSDDVGGSGIGSFDIFVSTDGGVFTPWLRRTTETSATYIGQFSHAYRFYSVARDNVGHEELAPATFDTETSVVPLAHTPSVTDATTDEDTQSNSGLVISRNAADGSEVTHLKITNITGGTLFLNDGTTVVTADSFVLFADGLAGLKFTPSQDSVAAGHFTVQASTSNTDAGLGGDTVTATITVNPINDAPTVANAIADQDAVRDVLFSFQFAADTFNDVDAGDSLTLTATKADGSALPGWLSFTPGTRTFSGTPSIGDVGPVDIKVTATDSSLASISDTFAINVINTNAAPTAVALANAVTSLAENTSTATHIKLADINVTDDGFGTNVPNLSGTDAGSFEIVGTELFLKSGTTLDFEAQASYSVTVNVDDTSVGSTSDASTRFTLTISDVNEAPTVANAIPDQTADSGVAFSFQFSAAAFSDVDAGDSLTYTAKKADGSPLPMWLNFNGGARTFAGTPAEADVTNFDFFVIATDSGTTPLSVSDTVHLTVRDKTAPIVSLSVPAKTNDNTPSITVSATDGASGIAGQTVTIDVDLDHSNTFGDAVGELGYTTGTMSAGAPFTTTFDLVPSLSDGTYGVRARIDDAAGNSGTSGTQTLLIDTIAPTATITTLQTSPTKVTSINYKVTFNEAVSNIAIDDFGLTLIPVTGGSVTANIASVSASSVSAGGNVTVVVNGIVGNGSLVLTLNPGSDITDGAGNVVSTASSSAIALDQTKPTADIVNVTPDPRSGPIGSITVKFSESVTGLDLGDFTLERTTISFSGSTTTTVSLATATLSGSGSTYSIGLLTGLTAVEGTYLLTLKSSGTGIVDAAGNEQDTVELSMPGHGTWYYSPKVFTQRSVM